MLQTFFLFVICVTSKQYNKVIEGTYEFEIMGRLHKFYLCDSSSTPSKPYQGKNKNKVKNRMLQVSNPNKRNSKDTRNSLHWAIADVTNNEYTIGMFILFAMHSPKA